MAVTKYAPKAPASVDRTVVRGAESSAVSSVMQFKDA